MKGFTLYIILFVLLCSSAEALESERYKIGARLQGMLSFEDDFQDMYLRRTRLNFEFYPWEGHSFVYDVRNDRANQGDRGNGEFSVGDAYWKIKLDHPTFQNVKLFRSKVDVSYSQTSSSKHLFNPERTVTAEKASSFVVQDRRANNVQVNGTLGQAYYQIAVSDGVNSGDLEDLSGDTVSSVEGQKLTYGGKLRYFFIGNPKKTKIQDTYYGHEDVLSLGIGHFRNEKITAENATRSVEKFSFGRNLTNIELSFANKTFRLLSEYFLFENDLSDLSASTKEDILTNSQGGYIQGELYFGKIAPFAIYERFNLNQKEENSDLTSYSLGVNYYQNLDESLRYGMVFKNTEYGEEFDERVEEQFSLYVMLDV